MNLDFSEEQRALRTAARDFLKNEFNSSLLRKTQQSPTGHNPELWAKMASMGWLGLCIPKKYGGAEANLMNLMVLLEEMGRVCFLGPFFSTIVLSAIPIANWGSETQKQQLLPKIAAGKLIMTLALSEPAAQYTAKGISTKAVSKGDDYIINGTKLFVSDASIANYIICAVKTKEDKNEEKTITLFIIDTKESGITISPILTSLDKQYEVVFKNVRVNKSMILGSLNNGWPIIQSILQLAAVAKCADSAGGAQRVLEMATNYAKERVQYGKAIGSNQAIQHYCANMWVSVETTRNITYQAAWKLSEGMPCDMEVSIAKAWVNEAYKRVTTDGLQIHGAIGLCEEHDVQAYYRRAKSSELMFGTSDFHREVVATKLGL